MATITVDINGGGDHTSINAAIAAAMPGDTILVSDGTYNENVVIDKSLSLLSVNGRDSVSIVGQGGTALGAVLVTPGVNDVTIGAPGQGFTIVGIDNVSPGIESAALYFQGSHDNITIQGNDVVANGDAGLSTEFAGSNTNFLIDGNIFSGQTFSGPSPAGNGFGTQFTEANVPRQLVVIGSNNGGGASSHIVFTNNEITGTAGGLNASNQPQGNTLVTIDAANSTISDNTFTGFTNRFATQLRSREENTNIQNNTFSNDSGGNLGAFVENDGQPGIVSGNATTYGPEDNLIFATAGNDAIDGGGGNDTYDMTVAGTGGSIVDLQAGTAFSGATGFDTLANIENVRGSSGADALLGTSQANIFFATAGSDTINGRDGSDTFNASAAATAVTVNLATGSVTGAFTASLSNVENAVGGSAGDTFTGSAAVNTFTGNGGTDTFNGLGNGDSVDGGADIDTVNIDADFAEATIAETSAGVFTVTVGSDTFTVTNAGVLVFNDTTARLVSPGGDFGTIQSAIAASAAGDAVIVGQGTYSGNVSISVTGLQLIGLTGAELEGTFRSDNAIATGTTVAEFLETAPSYNGASGAAITIGASGVSINGLTISSFYQGFNVGTSDGVSLDGVSISDTVIGINKSTAAQITNFSLLNSSISDSYHGMIIAAAVGAGAFDGVTIDNVTFTGLTEKGIYAEQLSNASLTNITMTNVGEFGRGPSFGPAIQTGEFGNGIDINLKYGSFDNILIDGFTFTDVGSSSGPDMVPQDFGAAISIKARTDAPSYNSNPASATNVTVSNGTIDGTSTGIRIGEPGKIIDGPALTVTNVVISNETVADYDNVTTSTLTVNTTTASDDDSVTVASTTTGNVVVNGGTDNNAITTGGGNDKIVGGGGEDNINGGAGSDSATFGVSADSVTSLTETGGVITLVINGETVTLTNVEKLSFSDLTVHIVGAGSENTTIQSGIDAAMDGDVVFVASGTYAENVQFNKSVEVVSSNAGIAGNAETRDAATGDGEVTIIGRSDITATGPVVIDGLRFLNNATTTGGGPSDPTLNVLTGAGHKIENSVFFSTVTGGAAGDRAIMIPPIGSGTVEVTGNYITGSQTGLFGTASWSTGLWMDGGGVNVTIAGNTFEYNRTALNLDVGSTSDISVTGNTFSSAGTGISGGVNIGTVLDGISGNNFQNVGTDFNFRNLTTNTVFDAQVAVGTVTPADPANPANDVVIVYGGIGNDELSGTSGNDYLDDNAGGASFESSTAVDNDVLDGRGGNDLLIAEFGADTLIGGEGNDTLDGGAGLDEAQYAGNFDDYTIVFDAGTGKVIVTDNNTADDYDEGTDNLVNVETLVFADGVVRLVSKNPAFGVFGTIQAGVNAAQTGDLVLVADGVYTENVTISTGGISIASLNNAGIDPNGVDPRGAESQLKGAILVNAGAANVTVDGLQITDGGLVFGQSRGIVALATGLTVANSIIENTTGTSGFKLGIETGYAPSGPAQDITLTNNLIDGWTFGAYLNPGTAGLVDGNVFSGNNVGVAVDNPGNIAPISITENTFDGNISTHIGSSTGVSIDYSVSIAGNNTFTGPATQVSISPNFANFPGPLPNPQVITGTAFNDRLVASSGPSAITFDGLDGDDTATGTNFGDSLTGGLGNDTLFGGAGNDIIIGGVGNDVIDGGTGNDTLVGDAGNDVIDGRSGADSMNGGLGNDTYYWDNVADQIIELAGGGTDQIRSLISLDMGASAGLQQVERGFVYGGSNATIFGNNLGNVVAGNDGNNRLEGRGGADIINGGGGNDFIIGGTERDVMTGGAGRDGFRFATLTDSGNAAGTRDIITDFTTSTQTGSTLISDYIDLSLIDADLTSAAHAFTFIGQLQFTGAGQLRFRIEGDNTIIEANVNADLASDFQIQLNGIKTLVGDDFIL